MNSITNLTPQQLRQAADLQEQILKLRNQLDRVLGSPSQDGTAAPGRKRRLSARRLANIRAGARKRWAKVRSNPAAGKRARRGKMSAAGRASIAAKMKAHWATAKRAGRNAL